MGAYLYVCVCGRAHTCVHVSVGACMRAFACGCMHACMYGWTYASMFVRMIGRMHVCMYVCMPTCMHVCMHVLGRANHAGLLGMRAFI